MKRIILASAIALSFASCDSTQSDVICEDLQFCESVLSYGDGMLIANFGSSELNPLNDEGKGYINYYAKGKMREFIAADGNLSAPKGMLVVGDKLYVADVNKLLVYDVNDTKSAPFVINMPQGELFVNHIVNIGHTLLISVTNSGNIFSIELDEVNMPLDITPELFINVIGANGLLHDKGTLYVASYPADGVTTPENLIYKIAELENPVAEPITDRPGQYDGLALEGSSLYFTDWQGGAVGKLDLESGEIEILNPDQPLGGPAEIDVVGGKIAVPDLVNSKVYLF